MDLSSLIANEKTISIPFPGLKGFEITIKYISKSVLVKLGEKCTIIGFDPKTSKATSELDNELFTKMYTEKTLLDWKGLKYKYLEDLLLGNEGQLPEEGCLPFTQDNALALIKNSTGFDTWLTSVMSDISLFNKRS